MRLLKATLKSEVAHLNKNNVRLGTIGHIEQLPKDVQDELHRSKEKLHQNTGLKLILALNYGGRQDIIQACNAILSKGITSVTEQYLTSHLYTGDLPDPDLLIRTSGEFRISNFLLWQIAYAELHITPVLWPDFNAKDFYKAILDYQSRERRFGALN
jgi:undecaprenyl diphosphate synthase